MGLPPLDKTPSALLSAHPGVNGTMITNWDTILAATAKDFENAHPGSNVFVFDTYSFLNGVLANAAQEHITNTTAYCPSYAAADIGWNYAAYGCSPIYNYFWFSE